MSEQRFRERALADIAKELNWSSQTIQMDYLVNQREQKAARFIAE